MLCLCYVVICRRKEEKKYVGLIKVVIKVCVPSLVKTLGTRLMRHYVISSKNLYFRTDPDWARDSKIHLM